MDGNVKTLHAIIMLSNLELLFGANQQQYVFEYPAGKSGVPVFVPGC